MNVNITAFSYNLTDDYIEINDKQSVILNLKIRDDTGELWTPTVLKWQLSDENGNVLNGRTFSTVQTTTDKITLGYHDTKIIIDEETEEIINKKILSIAAGVTINNINIQQNFEVQIKIKELVNNFPNVFETETGLDQPFDNLDTPFTNLESTF